jgi:hypothetical protein
MDVRTYVRDRFPHKEFIRHRPLWEPMPKKGPGSKQDHLEERSLTFYTTNQISEGTTPGRPIGYPGFGHPQGIFGIFSYYQLVMF